jgi:anaerobic ribonucleoside-triphosphate reductase activating protein
LGEVEGVSVSGGEPFEQEGELLALLEAVGEIGLHRLVYTGYTYEALRLRGSHVTGRCLEEIEILIDGAYERDIPPYIPWAGSGNQRVIQIEGGEVRKIYGRGEVVSSAGADGEIVIDRSGGILTTGIIDSRVFAGRRADEPEYSR